MDIQTISSASDHEAALVQIEKMLGVSSSPGTVESEKLERLILLVEAYEDEHFPLVPVSADDAMRFRIQEQGTGLKGDSE